MQKKLLIQVGNLYHGYPYGVEVEGHFGTREIHGPFGSENEANNYMHDLCRERPYYGSTKSIKVVKVETPQATGTKVIVWRESDPPGSGGFVYESEA